MRTMTKRKFEVGDKFYVLNDFPYCPDIERGDIVTLVEKQRYMDRFVTEEGIRIALKETSVEKITEHPQAENMLLYAQDAKKSETPWQWWEARNRGDEGAWHNIYCHPYWCPDTEYRQKPRFIKIGEWEVPEPVRKALELDDDYWVVSFEGDRLTRPGKWHDFPTQRYLMCRGLIHRTREAAEAHARALIEVSGGKV